MDRWNVFSPNHCKAPTSLFVLGSIGSLVLQEKIIPYTFKLRLSLFALWLTTVVDPNVFEEYLQAFLKYPPTLFATPTIGGLLRYYLIGINQFWPQFIPMGIGFLWCIYHWYKHNEDWQWSKEVPNTVFASIILSSYCWTYDMVLLIVPVLQAWIWLVSSWKGFYSGVLSLIHFLISLLDLISHRYLDDFWFFWFAPVTLLWYLLLAKITKSFARKRKKGETFHQNSSHHPPPGMSISFSPEDQCLSPCTIIWRIGLLGLLTSDGGNPYSPSEMFTLQEQLGWDQHYPLMMFNTSLALDHVNAFQHGCIPI